MTRAVDAVVIGSGAGGGIMAYELARRGLAVAVVEAGRREDPTTFEHRETAMLPRLYKNGGLQTTVDHDVVIAQGGTVGGSTVINNAIWIRADLDRVLGDWKRAGIDLPKAPLVAAYEEIERALNVSPIPPVLVNRGAGVFMRGAEKLGRNARFLQHNRKECTGCGWCNYGCRYNRKTSMLVTYIPWAEARGAMVYDACRDVRIRTNGRRAFGVTCFRSGQELTFDAGRVVVCAGAVGSSAVLLQSGIDLDGRVGRGLHLLGGVLVSAEMPDAVDGYDGIGLTSIVETDPEYLIESFFAPPLVFSVSLGGFFLDHFRRMMRYRYYANAGVMVGTDPTGRVSLDRKKRVRIRLKFSERDVERLCKGISLLSRMFFADGALRVLPATFKQIEFEREDQLDGLDQKVRRPNDLLLGSAHPQGGNPLHEDPARGVVGTSFRVHGYENVFVADASVFPTNIWANCQATVMAVSHYAAGFVAGEA